MAVVIGKERIDEDKLGRLRLSVQWKADTRSEALTGIPRTRDGLPIAGKSSTPWISTAGEYLVDAVYEGLIDDPDPSQDEYDIVTESHSTKIETFPDRAKLVEDYGAMVDSAGKISFPPTLPKPPSRLGTPLTLKSYKGGNEETQNPLWNATEYDVPHSAATWRMIRKRVPSSLQKQSLTVIDRLPSGFDYTGPKTKWYVKPLQKRKRGNAWEIEWSAFEILDFADLQVLLALQGKSRESGLTTGSL